MRLNVAGIADGADATAITIDSNETVWIKNTIDNGNYLDGELTSSLDLSST